MSALARELHGGPGGLPGPGSQATPEDVDDDPELDETDTWSDYADERG